MVSIENPNQLRVIQTGIWGLKIPWPKGRAGSTPASGIIVKNHLTEISKRSQK